MPTISAVIIARGGSTRLANKNMLDLDGYPLIAHKVRQLREVPEIKDIYVGSDSPEIIDAAFAHGAIPVKRAAEYCDEKSRSWNDVICDMASRVKGDIIVWAHCTNPCILPKTYSRAIESYMATEYPDGSLVGVTKIASHFWFHGTPLNFQPRAAQHQVAVKLSPLLHQNGGLFIYSRQRMIRDKYVYGNNPILFEIDPDEAIDIDTGQDLERARKLYWWVSSRG